MSEVKVNKISPRTNCGTVTLGDSGDSFVIPAGATITNNGTQSGFGREGSVNWQTGSLKTSTFTAASGEGYFINSGSSITVNLPAGSAGAIVAFSDYARNFSTYNLIISANGSEKIGGSTDDAKLNVDGQAATFVYVDSTKGWINVQNAEDTEVGQSDYVIASGGTESTCGDFKIHTFTGPGNFVVTNAGTACGSNAVEYLVVAGGGGTGGTKYNFTAGAGAGAGGFRFASPSLGPVTYPAKPLAGPAGLAVPANTYPITVGAGGAGGPAPTSPADAESIGGNGNPSTFSTITSTGGGAGGNYGGPSPKPSTRHGQPGGSGGGIGGPGAPSISPAPSGFGAGNTPPVSPSQGNPGGVISDYPTNPTPGNDNSGAGAGGGALAAGGNGSGCSGGGAGGVGAGLPTAFGANGQPCGSFRYYAGGGGGGTYNPSPGPSAGGAGGLGGGGAGKGGADSPNVGTNATANTGGGGGAPGTACSPTSPKVGGAGGSGIVVIRYKFQN
jgi:hypothetical protein